MDHAETPRAPVTRIEIAPRTIGSALLAIAGVWLFAKLWEIVVVVVVALVLVGTLNPIVAALEHRGLKRGWAIALVFIGLLASVAIVIVITVPPLVAQLIDLSHHIPEIRQRVMGRMEQSALMGPLVRMIAPANSGSLLASVARRILAWSPRIAEGLTLFVTTVFLALYFIADRERTQGLVFALTPRRYHLRLARVLLHLETIVGGYVRGQVVTSALMAVFVFLLLSLMHVRNAMAYAVFAGITDVLPFVGGLIGTTPVVLAALGCGVGPATIALVAMVVYQEFESRVLVPRVYGRVLRLSPAMVILALLAGGKLLGIVGALLAIPIAAGIQMLIHELRVELPGENIDDEPLRRRDDRAERMYAAQTNGAPAETAAVVAVQIAEAIREADAHEVGDEKDAAAVPLTGGEEDDRDPTKGE
jgi:predicted PurR-regulated permease PerM